MVGFACGGAPAAGPAGGGPASFGGLASCACADSASNEMAETTGRMILMRLDALMRAGPLLFPWPCFPGAIDESPRAGLMPAEITALLDRLSPVTND